MKNKRMVLTLITIAIALVAITILTGILKSSPGSAAVTITVLNPLGQIEPPENQPLAERLRDLNNKRLRWFTMQKR